MEHIVTNSADVSSIDINCWKPRRDFTPAEMMLYTVPTTLQVSTSISAHQKLMGATTIIILQFYPLHIKLFCKM